MLLYHLIIWNLLIHFVLWSLSIESSQRLLSKTNVARSGRLNDILPLDTLDVLAIEVATVPIHFHECARLFIHVFKLHMVKVIVLSCVCGTYVVSKVASSYPASLFISRLDRDAGILLYCGCIIIADCHERRYRIQLLLAHAIMSGVGCLVDILLWLMRVAS